MGGFRKFLFFIGIILFVLPILSFLSILDLIPLDPNLGFLNNDVLSLIIGVILLSFVFLSWKKEKRMMSGRSFKGPRGPGDAQFMPGMARELEKRRQREAEMIRRNAVMQMKAIDKRYGTA